MRFSRRQHVDVRTRSGMTEFVNYLVKAIIDVVRCPELARLTS